MMLQKYEYHKGIEHSNALPVAPESWERGALGGALQKVVIGNFIILELSPWNFHHEIPCYWVKFHAIINFTREAQVITYLCTYLCFFTVFRTYPMYYLPGTSCESS